VVPGGSIVNPMNGMVTYPDGSIHSNSDLVCLQGNSAGSLGTNGNLAFGYITISGGAFTSFKDSWSVPSAPSNGNFANGQSDGLWDGLQTGNGGDVFQPVLQYGCIAWNGFGCQVGGNSWYIYDESNYVTGTIYISGATQVSLGDSLTGKVNYLGSTSACSYYNEYDMYVTDNTLGTTRSFTGCDRTYPSWAAAGSLETQSLSYCNQLPNTTSKVFSSIVENDNGGTLTYSTATATSTCGISVTTPWGAGSNLQLNWNPNA